MIPWTTSHAATDNETPKFAPGVGPNPYLRFGYFVIALQFVGLVLWSSFLVSRNDLTMDFAIYHQAVWSIQHGNLNPFDSINSFAFWRSHGEFIMWPIALVGELWPHLPTLLWIQDAAIVLSEAVAYRWICSELNTDDPIQRSSRTNRIFALCGLCLLVLNPWTYKAASWDFHAEIVGVFFLVLTGWQVRRDPTSRLVWLWAALALSCGDVVSSYVIALGAGIAISSRQRRKIGVTLISVGVVWLIFLSIAGANRGSSLAEGYGYLAATAASSVARHVSPVSILVAIVRHPSAAASVLWSRRGDVYAALAPEGLVGIVSPLAGPLTIAVILENALNSYAGYLVPNFQDAALFVMIPIGTVILLKKVSSRTPKLAPITAAMLMLNSLGWAMVWLPQVPQQWLQVSPSAAKVLDEIRTKIPASAEVIASQGVVGSFSSHRWVYPLIGLGTVPIHSHDVWVIVTPQQGIETLPVVNSEALISRLFESPHATLVAHRNGVWAFRLTMTKEAPLVIPHHPTSILAVTTPGPVGRSVISNTSTSSRVVSTGRTGYVVSGDYWPEPPGRFRAEVSVAATSVVNVEVWNATANVLLARRSLTPTSGEIHFHFSFAAKRRYPHYLFRGVFPFVSEPIPAQKNNILEIRVWAPSNGHISVYSVALRSVP